ncbi:lysophospholipid acyltransferase family protein [Endozoicomonas sp. ALD040]|uniref:lysophospholipid acyltransferase family protein n=1 Tax=unclassified Endozoicomonas TaxID=2644528 RepID=UPI003BAEAF6C
MAILLKSGWKDSVLDLLIGLLSRTPQVLYSVIGLIFSYVLRAKKGHIARASLQLALLPVSEKTHKQIIRQSARHTVDYILTLPFLDKVPYLLNNQDVIARALSENKGVVVLSLHLGPPDLGTLALSQRGLPATTLIGSGKQSPLTHKFGKAFLLRVGIEPIVKGDPTALLQALKKKKAVFLYSDLRSKEMPVTFFGQATRAPACGIMTAHLLKTPVLFHYCTFENNQWQLHFEPLPLTRTGNRKLDTQHDLQQLMHRMEQVIRENPQLWIWHYDRFKLKNKIYGNKSISLSSTKPDVS